MIIELSLETYMVGDAWLYYLTSTPWYALAYVANILLMPMLLSASVLWTVEEEDYGKSLRYLALCIMSGLNLIYVGGLNNLL